MLLLTIFLLPFASCLPIHPRRWWCTRLCLPRFYVSIGLSAPSRFSQVMRLICGGFTRSERCGIADFCENLIQSCTSNLALGFHYFLGLFNLLWVPLLLMRKLLLLFWKNLDVSCLDRSIFLGFRGAWSCTCVSVLPRNFLFCGFCFCRCGNCCCFKKLRWVLYVSL